MVWASHLYLPFIYALTCLNTLRGYFKEFRGAKSGPADGRLRTRHFGKVSSADSRHILAPRPLASRVTSQVTKSHTREARTWNSKKLRFGRFQTQFSQQR